MAIEHQKTQEEEAYERLLKETWAKLSEPGRTVLEEAELASHGAHMVHSYCYQQEEYEEAISRMHDAAAKLTGHEHKLLSRLWRVALAAAASIDSEDFETSVGYRVYSKNLHWYYRMVSGMVEEVLAEKKAAELRRELLERGPQDPWDIQF